MKRMLPLAALLLVGACKSPEGSTPSHAGPEPELGTKEAVYIAIDGKSRTRLAYVERWNYRSGILYWVTDLARVERLGYVLSNGRARRYAWVMGEKSRVIEDLGSDTLEVGVRRILGVNVLVELEETSEKILADAMAAKIRAEREAAAAKPAEGGGGAEDGCGCGE
ncbi:MAG: hypothetical protein ACT4PV_00055 [Planctomycetaceae bacterium]